MILRGQVVKIYHLWTKTLLLRLGSHNKVLLVCIIVIMLTLAVIPFCSGIFGLASVLAVMGLFMGTIDTVSNMSMLKLFGKDVAPFLQVWMQCNSHYALRMDYNNTSVFVVSSLFTSSMA